MNPNQEVNNRLVVTVIIAAGIAIPSGFAYRFGVTELVVSPALVLFAALYLMVIAGFVSYAVGKRGAVLTSEQTDQRIAEFLRDARRKLRPVAVILLLLLLAWIVSLIWQLYWNI